MCEPLAISRLDPTNFHNSGFYFISWRAMAEKNWASLRWPPRLYASDLPLLRDVVDNNNAPVRVPVELEMRVARRNALLVAMRAHGFPDKRIPFRLAKGPIHVYLRKSQWPRSRAVATALVGAVALAMQGDIFASLPQLVIAVICDRLFALHDMAGFKALVHASDAFALGASIWAIEQTDPNTKQLNRPYVTFCEFEFE
jgi:hypothetical protein